MVTMGTMAQIGLVDNDQLGQPQLPIVQWITHTYAVDEAK